MIVWKQRKTTGDVPCYQCEQEGFLVELFGSKKKDLWTVVLYNRTSDRYNRLYSEDFQTETGPETETQEELLQRAQKTALWRLENACTAKKNFWKDIASVVYSMRLA